MISSFFRAPYLWDSIITVTQKLLKVLQLSRITLPNSQKTTPYWGQSWATLSIWIPHKTSLQCTKLDTFLLRLLKAIQLIHIPIDIVHSTLWTAKSRFCLLKTYKYINEMTVEKESRKTNKKRYNKFKSKLISHPLDSLAFTQVTRYQLRGSKVL